MVMRRCEDHRFFDVWDLPKAAKGVTVKAAPPKIAPMSLLHLLNDICRVLDTVSQGTKPLVQATWLGKGNWQIELSGTNALASETGTVSGRIESPDHFQQAVRQAGQQTTSYFGSRPLMEVLSEDFEPTFTWTTKPGGILVLTCATKPEVNTCDDGTGRNYWEVE